MPITDHQFADALGHVITEKAKALGFGDNAWNAGNALSRATRIPSGELFSGLAAVTRLTFDQLETIAEHLGTEAATLEAEARSYAQLAHDADTAVEGLAQYTDAEVIAEARRRGLPIPAVLDDNEPQN